MLRVVDELRVGGPASRAELARRTGLSRTTVSTLVAELQERGLVVEQDGAREAGIIGRPGVLVALDAGSVGGVGIDIDHDRVTVAVGDLSRTVLGQASAEADVDHDAAAAIELVGELVDRVLADAGLDRTRVLGAGVAIAGPVDQATGVVRETPILPSWRGLDVAAAMGERLAMPVQVDNDANLGALAEATFGAAAGARFAVYVSVGAGIGAGLVVDGRPYRGWRGIAGELGHVLVDPAGRICRCGNRGCLETVATTQAMLELLHGSGRDVTVGEVLDLAADGDAGARRAIADVGRAVGRALAAAVCLLGPEVVVVGGDLSRAGALLVDPLEEALTRFALPIAMEELRVVPGALGERANLLGALALVIAEGGHAAAARLVEAVEA